MQTNSTICVVELGLWRDYAQTKRNRHRPWCEDGAYALGLGILMPHTIVGAKATPRHGCGGITKIIYSQTGFLDLV